MSNMKLTKRLLKIIAKQYDDWLDGGPRHDEASELAYQTPVLLEIIDDLFRQVGVLEADKERISSELVEAKINSSYYGHK